jgi:AcrR family transcriptional regulator
MPRSIGRTDTREKLLHAAEQLFATHGVDGAQTRDIVRLAEQANPSAVQYHFGSRDGLLDAIMTIHQDHVEQALAPRLPDLPGMDLAELFRVLVEAEATELRSDRGRHALRISAQLGRQARTRAATPHPAPPGPGHRRLLDHLTERLAVPPGGTGLPQPVRRERLGLALTLVGAALADRARQYTEGEQPLTDEPYFLADLAGMAAALVQAPRPTA